MIDPEFIDPEATCVICHKLGKYHNRTGHCPTGRKSRTFDDYTHFSENDVFTYSSKNEETECTIRCLKTLVKELIDEVTNLKMENKDLDKRISDLEYWKTL